MMNLHLASTDGLVALLFSGVVLFAVLAIAVQWVMPGHDVLLTFIIGLSNQFAGGLFLLIRGKGSTVDASGRNVEVNLEQAARPEK